MPEFSGTKSRAIEAYKAGQAEALDLIDAALSKNPEDETLLVAQAAQSALDGQVAPFERLEKALQRRPEWIEGQKELVRLKREFEAAAPFATIEQALLELPDHPRLWMAYLGLLASDERYFEAAEHAAALCKRIGDVPGLLLLEARFAGLGGDSRRAKRLLDTLPPETPQLEYERARNALRLDDFEAASHHIEAALEEDPKDTSAWALAELAWRKVDPKRHNWLILNGRAISRLAIDIEVNSVSQVIAGLHRTRSAPLGQSLKFGTQTRGDLRWRQEPEIAKLFAEIEAKLDDYWEQLPIISADHPMASLSGLSPQVKASWSVMLHEGGHHVSHLHNNGIISSALHLMVPESLPGTDGRLELGRAPVDMPAGFEPLLSFVPQPGFLVLFPSFLYHGTSPFSAGERLTVAFDAG